MESLGTNGDHEKGEWQLSSQTPMILLLLCGCRTQMIVYLCPVFQLLFEVVKVTLYIGS